MKNVPVQVTLITCSLHKLCIKQWIIQEISVVHPLISILYMQCYAKHYTSLYSTFCSFILYLKFIYWFIRGKNVMVARPCLTFHSLPCDNMVHHTAWRQLRLYSAHLTTYICTEDNEINSDDGISWMIRRWQWWRTKCF